MELDSSQSTMKINSEKSNFVLENFANSSQPLNENQLNNLVEQLNKLHHKVVSYTASELLAFPLKPKKI